MRFSQLQEEMLTWQQHNFPNRTAWEPLVGMVEEVGELVESESTDRGIVEILDAVGDVGIYMADYCNAKGYNMDTLWETAKEPTYGITVNPLASASIHMGRVCHAHLKEHQNIRVHENHPAANREALSRLMIDLDRVCVTYLTTFELVVEITWAKVSKRDWRKDRNTAHVQA